MKKYAAILLILISSLSFAQNFVEAKIITMNNDTIKSKMRVSPAMFSKQAIDIRSFVYGLYLFDDNLEKKGKLPAKEVKRLEFNDFQGTLPYI